MTFEKQPIIWQNKGTEPTTQIKESGFTAGYKPPAAYHNFLFALLLDCIKEIQNNLSDEEFANYVETVINMLLTSASNTNIVSVSELINELKNKAPIASPTFTGTPKATTPETTDNSTRIATTAYVLNKIQEILSLSGIVSLKSIGINFSWSLGSHGTDMVSCSFQYTNMQNEDITDWYTDISECSFGNTAPTSTNVRALWIGISKYNKSILKVILADGTATDAGSSSLPEGYNFTCVARSLMRPSTYKGLYTLTDGTITAQDI